MRHPFHAARPRGRLALLAVPGLGLALLTSVPAASAQSNQVSATTSASGGGGGGRRGPARILQLALNINWDASNGYNFADTVAPHLANLS